MRRVLIVSATMGEGHNATARALREAIGRLWPDAKVEQVDVLDAMGYGSGPLFRWIYATSVERLPKLYEFFYGSVWRHHWFALAAKRVIGSWSGRKLAPAIDEATPDLVLSTYPMASTGLEWLRRHRGLAVPTGAWVSDFAPHPSWVHTGVDLNLVMHDVAVPVAEQSVPGALVAVSAPPVSSDFRPVAPAEEGHVVVACGSLGFGKAERTVAELLDADPLLRVTVVTGRNERMRARLAGSDPRVTALGWVDDMPALLSSADFVVTNAGGATFLEALACGRMVVMHDPIAGHGRANAALMETAGLATVCTGPGSLTAAARDLVAHPELVRERESAIARHLAAHQLEDGLRALQEFTPAHPLRPQDAQFVHVWTDAVPQQVGTVLVFDEAPTRADAVRLLAAVPGVDGRLRAGSGWRRAWWRPGSVKVDELVDEVTHTDLDTAVDEFFSVPLKNCGAARLVTTPDGGAILVKLHHALGDGIMVLRALLSASDGTGAWAGAPVRTLGGPRLRPERVVRGLWNMLRAGSAPSAPWTGAVPGPQRHHERVLLPLAALRRTARELDVSVSELVHAVFAEAVHRTCGGRTIRLMVPWSLRGTSSLRASGNSAGALSADLPVGPMPVRERVDRVAEALRECADGGMPALTAAVVRTLGKLPPPLHRLACRLVYRSAWFTAIGTVLPGPRRPVRVGGALLTAAYPVLPLAPGVGLTWGAMTWGENMTVGVTVAAPLAGEARRIGEAMRAAFDEVAVAP